MKRVLILVCLSIGMLSCSSDNNHRGGLTIEQLFPTKQRKISQIIANYGYFEGYSGIYKYVFYYNNDKFQSVHVERENDDYNISIGYKTNTSITISDKWDDYDADINNSGYITCMKKSSSGYSLYSYDNQGCLINEQDMYNMWDYVYEGNTVITWNNGNIIKTQHENNDGGGEIYTWEATYKYNDKLTKLVNLDLNWFVDPMHEYCDVDYIIGAAGFMGTKCKNYKIERKSGSGSIVKYDWSYDDLGYPTKCVITDYNDDISTIIFMYMD